MLGASANDTDDIDEAAASAWHAVCFHPSMTLRPLACGDDVLGMKPSVPFGPRGG